MKYGFEKEIMALKRNMDLQKKKKMGVHNVMKNYQEVWI